MRQEGTFLVGTDFHLDNWYAHGRDSTAAREMYERVRDRLALAHRLGVRVVYGTDVVIDLPGLNRIESSLRVLETWKATGVPAMDVLRSMTADAAELLGMGEERGRVGVSTGPTSSPFPGIRWTTSPTWGPSIS